MEKDMPSLIWRESWRQGGRTFCTLPPIIKSQCSPLLCRSPLLYHTQAAVHLPFTFS
uniref:Uncharacterized protein n=1 Tax=Arundo donax TaxID=35708 RepID=A0A0A8ZWC6_ARUDO